MVKRARSQPYEGRCKLVPKSGDHYQNQHPSEPDQTGSAGDSTNRERDRGFGQ